MDEDVEDDASTKVETLSAAVSSSCTPVPLQTCVTGSLGGAEWEHTVLLDGAVCTRGGDVPC
jgi:hypothetical protein